MVTEGVSVELFLLDNNEVGTVDEGLMDKERELRRSDGHKIVGDCGGKIGVYLGVDNYTAYGIATRIESEDNEVLVPEILAIFGRDLFFFAEWKIVYVANRERIVQVRRPDHR